jgi:hypothetical protein
MLEVNAHDLRTTTVKTRVNVDTGEVQVNEDHDDRREIVVVRGLPETVQTPRLTFQPKWLSIKWHYAGTRRGEPYWYHFDTRLTGYQLKKDGTPGARQVEFNYYGMPEDAREEDFGRTIPEYIAEVIREYHPGTGKHPYTYALSSHTADDDV